MELKNYKADYYINKIKNGEHFSLTRWGDGEWFCATGRQGANCDKHQYFPAMRAGLNQALKHDQGYYKAIWDKNHGQIMENLNIILPHIARTNPDIDWVNANIWEQLAINDNMGDLVSALESVNFVIVSNANKRTLSVKHVDYVEVPAVNCFLDKERIKREMIEVSERHGNVVFGMSASMTTNVIVDELYPIIGDKCSMIDFGSIWEPFVGNNNRSYHREYKNTTL